MLISDLLTKLSHHIPSRSPIQWCSNAKNIRKPALESHVSKTHNKINFTDALQTRPSINKRMSHTCHICSQLVNGSRGFCMHEDAHSDVRSSGEIQAGMTRRLAQHFVSLPSTTWFVHACQAPSTNTKWYGEFVVDTWTEQTESHGTFSAA